MAFLILVIHIVINLTEYYNAKGSSYWCLKAFIFLLDKLMLFNIKPLEMVREDYNSFIPHCSLHCLLIMVNPIYL